VSSVTVLDRGVSECVDPEGNGVNPGRGTEGGPSPPNEGLDKQLDSDSGGASRKTARQVRCGIKNPSCTEYLAS
jgi:hypothetical protein